MGIDKLSGMINKEEGLDNQLRVHPPPPFTKGGWVEGFQKCQ